MDDELFAARSIRAARGRAAMGQRALALAAGVAPSVVCADETGARQPSAKMPARLVRAAGAQLAVVDPVYERQRQERLLEVVVAAASRLPQRPHQELEDPASPVGEGMLGQQPSTQSRDRAGDEVRARKADLESVVGMASALARRAPGPLTLPPFRELIRRS